MIRSRIVKWLYRLLGLALVLAFIVCFDGAPSGLAQSVGTESVEDTASRLIPIQGRLTDSSGAPINGSRTMAFNIYNVPTDGAALCSQSGEIILQNGVFNTVMSSCPAEIFNGQQLYVGITVGLDTEMTPRQPIYPAPYASSLIPAQSIFSLRMNDFDILYSTGTKTQYQYSNIEVSRTSPGDLYMLANISVPSMIYGAPLKLVGIRICTYSEVLTNYISQIEVYHTDGTGYVPVLLVDDTGYANTGFYCFISHATTPTVINGPLTIFMIVNFTDPDPAYSYGFQKIDLLLEP